MKASTRTTMPLAAAVAALTLFPAGAALAQDAPPCVVQNEQGSPVAVPCPPEQQPTGQQPPAEQPPEEIGVLPGVVDRGEQPAPAGEQAEAAPVVRSAAQEQLPRTGTDAGILAALGAAGVFAGVGALVMSRRRRSEA